MALTIEKYLKGKFEFNFTDLNILSALAERGVDEGTAYSDVSQKDVDLVMSDLYMIVAEVTTGNGKSVRKGNNSITDKSYSMSAAERRVFRDKAIKLRLKWGEVTEIEPSAVFANMYEHFN